MDSVVDQYKLYGKGSEWHYELKLLNIIIVQCKLFNKCYYSCLELIEFIFSIAEFREMMVETFCI